MNGWLLDASVLLAREDTEDEHHHAARRLLDEGTLAAATLDLAYYEVANVALRAWNDAAAAGRLRELIGALADDAGLVRVDSALIAAAIELAETHTLSAYAAAYVAAARLTGFQLVSCDIRDLVSQELALAPAEAIP